MTITWRPATEDDVGRLARFRDCGGDDWSYGLLSMVGDDGHSWCFRCCPVDGDLGEDYWYCEVQEVTP